MFKKEDLKNGMIVEFNTGDRRLVWEDRLIDKLGYIPMSNINKELYNLDSLNREYITKIHLAHDIMNLNSFFNSKSLTCIWDRNIIKGDKNNE